MALPAIALAVGAGAYAYGQWKKSQQKSASEKHSDAFNNSQFKDINQGDFMAPGLSAAANDYRNPYVGNQSDFRGDQKWILGQHRANIMGEGPGQQLASSMAHGAAQRGNQQQMAQAAGQRGNPLAARTAATNMANISGQAGITGMQGGLAAQQASMGAYGGIAGQARAGDLAYNRYKTGADLSGMNAQMQAMRMQQQGMMAYQNARNQRLGYQMGGSQLQTGGERNADMWTGMGTGLMTMGMAGYKPQGALTAAQEEAGATNYTGGRYGDPAPYRLGGEDLQGNPDTPLNYTGGPVGNESFAPLDSPYSAPGDYWTTDQTRRTG